MNKSSFEECFCLKEGNIKKSHSRGACPAGLVCGIKSGISVIFKGKSGGDSRQKHSGMTPFNVNALNKDAFRASLRSGFTLRPSSPRSVGVRGIGAAPALYPALQAFGMTKRSGHGFTLIELLVVVLIISVLAAVAVPQYNRAVKKARGVEVLTAAKALSKAVEAFYLENGQYGSTWVGTEMLEPGKLSVELPVLTHAAYMSSIEHGGLRSFSGFFGGDQTGLEEPFDKHISIFIDNGPSFTIGWNQGRPLGKARCQGKECSDYFNCTNVDIQVICGVSQPTGCDIIFN